MLRRIRKHLGILAMALIGPGLLLPSVWAQPSAEQPRIGFDIAAGPAASQSYIMAERLAGVVSHPPGITRCAAAGRCGPSGLISAARALDGTAAVLKAFQAAEVPSAILPAHILAEAKSKELRAIAVIEVETLVLIGPKAGPVLSLVDLKGRWVGTDVAGAGAQVAARDILAALKLTDKKVKIAVASPLDAAKLIKERRLDAYFAFARELPDEMKTLLKDGSAVLIPIEGPGLDALKQAGAYTASTSIADQTGSIANTRAGSSGIASLQIPLVWVVDTKVANTLVAALTSALWHQANRATLDEGLSDGAAVRPRLLPAALDVALHPGAAQYYESEGSVAN